MHLPAILGVFAHLICASPVYWRKEPTARDDLTTPLAIHKWSGKASTTGAFVLSRLKLNFLNNTCTQLASELKIAAQITQVLANTNLAEVTKNQVHRYGASLLRLETKYLETLVYQNDLLLCSGRGCELWSNYRKVKNEFSKV